MTHIINSKDGSFALDDDAHNAIITNFHKLFELTIYAVNPKNPEEIQIKKHKELKELFPFHIIPAERLLGEDGTQNSSLSALISNFFDMSEDELDPSVAEKVKELRDIVENANKNVQQQIHVNIFLPVIFRYLFPFFPGFSNVKYVLHYFCFKQVYKSLFIHHCSHVKIPFPNQKIQSF